MHDHISFAYNLERSTGTKLNLALFTSYRRKYFFDFRKPLLIYIFDMVFIILSNSGCFDS